MEERHPWLQIDPSRFLYGKNSPVCGDQGELTLLCFPGMRSPALFKLHKIRDEIDLLTLALCNNLDGGRGETVPWRSGCKGCSVQICNALYDAGLLGWWLLCILKEADLEDKHLLDEIRSTYGPYVWSNRDLLDEKMIGPSTRMNGTGDALQLFSKRLPLATIPKPGRRWYKKLQT
jgi:hypothetical protein